MARGDLTARRSTSPAAATKRYRSTARSTRSESSRRQSSAVNGSGSGDAPSSRPADGPRASSTASTRARRARYGATARPAAPAPARSRSEESAARNAARRAAPSAPACRSRASAPRINATSRAAAPHVGRGVRGGQRRRHRRAAVAAAAGRRRGNPDASRSRQPASARVEAAARITSPSARFRSIWPVCGGLRSSGTFGILAGGRKAIDKRASSAELTVRFAAVECG